MTLDRQAPDALRGIPSQFPYEYPELGGATATLYHVGISEDGGKAVQYVYRSEHDFETDQRDMPRFGGKPLPTLDSDPAEKVVVDLACRIRVEQDAIPSDQRVDIGGELRLTQGPVTTWSTTGIRRFQDYEAIRQTMNDHLIAEPT